MIAELIVLGIIASVYSQPLHHMMTPEELKNVFSVESAAEVPNYDVVPISIAKPRNRRMSESFLFQKPFGDKIRIWLNPLDGTLATINTPLWSIGSTDDEFNPIVTSRQDIVNSSLPWLYENTFHATTLAVNDNSNGRHTVLGFIGDKYIRPVPSHLMDHARRHRRSVNKALDHESNENYHVIYDIPKPEKNMLSLPIERLASKTTLESKESNLTILYPEILVIVDYKLQKMISESLIDIFLYILAFWNGVDMRYRSLENPKVRLNIAGIIIAEDEEVLSYIYEFAEDKFVLDAGMAVASQGYWLYHMNHTFPIESYDLAVTMLSYELCENEDTSNCNILGLARPAGACMSEEKSTDPIISIGKIAFVHDSALYDGILTAAHELGHLFGVEHDNITDNGCEDSDNYIMSSYNKFKGNSFDWSKCSLREMNKFFRSENASCLRNEPSNLNEFEWRYLPGKLITVEKQCEYFLNAKPYFENDKKEIDCQRVLCVGYKLEEFIEPVEGTRCGDGKLCLHGKCIDEKSIE